MVFKKIINGNLLIFIFLYLFTTNHRHSKYLEKFNDVAEEKKSGPEIAYGRTHTYGSLALKLSRFHCTSVHMKISYIYIIFVLTAYIGSSIIL